MGKYLERVNSINKTILRGCNTYADFLNLLIDFLPANEVLQKICLEIFEDYLNFRK